MLYLLKKFDVFLMIGIMGLLLTACGSHDKVAELPATATLQPPTDTPAPSLTDTPTPTFTLTPTSTPTVTPTPTVTSTPTATPTPRGGSGKLGFTLKKEGYASKFDLQGEENIFISNLDGSDLTPVPNNGLLGRNTIEGFSPDGKRVLISSFTQVSGWVVYFDESGKFDPPVGELYVVDIDGANVVKVSDKFLNSADSSSIWLTDGSDKIAFVAKDEKGYGIYLVNPDGSDLTRITNPIKEAQAIPELLHFSNDSHEIYWLKRLYLEGGRGHVSTSDLGIWSTKTDGSGEKFFSTLSKDVMFFSFSPDNKHYAFVDKSDDKQIGLGLVEDLKKGTDWDPASTTMIFKAPVPDADAHCSFEWSSDGRYLLITVYAFPDGVYHPSRYMYALQDETLTELPDIVDKDKEDMTFSTTLSPDGKLVLFERAMDPIVAILDLETMTFDQQFEQRLNPAGEKYPYIHHAEWVPSQP